MHSHKILCAYEQLWDTYQHFHISLRSFHGREVRRETNTPTEDGQTKHAVLGS